MKNTGRFLLVLIAAFQTNSSIAFESTNLISLSSFESNCTQESDKKAQFPGGESALKEWLKENLAYPKEAKRYGSVIVTFTVKKNGSLTDFQIHKGVNEVLDIAAVEILRGMPKWEPAMKGGKAVSSTIQLPVKFLPKED